jgi:hypothetical protein
MVRGELMVEESEAYGEHGFESIESSMDFVG